MSLASTIVCLVHEEGWGLVTSAAARSQPPTRAVSATSLLGLIHAGRYRQVVIDPTAVRDDVYEVMLSAARDHGASVYVLARLSQLSASQALRSALNGPTEVLFHGARNSNRAIRSALRSDQPLSASAWLLHLLAARVCPLEPSVRTVVVGLFGGLAIPRLVQDLADEAGFGRRAIERAVANAGLRSVKRLLDVVRVARAWDGMAAGRRSLHEPDLGSQR